MLSADLIAASVHDACPRCGALALQRWLTARARPAVSWSQCVRCDGIAIWEHGQLEHPPLGVVSSRAAVEATRAETVAQRERLLAGLRERYDELARARAQADEAAAFVVRYRRYSARDDAAMATRDATSSSSDMSRSEADAAIEAPLDDDRTPA